MSPAIEVQGSTVSLLNWDEMEIHSTASVWIICVYLHVRVQARGWCWVSFSITPHLLLLLLRKGISLAWNSPFRLGYLASEFQVHLSPMPTPTLGTDYRQMQTTMSGSELRFSCLCDKQFPSGAISDIFICVFLYHGTGIPHSEGSAFTDQITSPAQNYAKGGLELSCNSYWGIVRAEETWASPQTYWIKFTWLDRTLFEQVFCT